MKKTDNAHKQAKSMNTKQGTRQATQTEETIRTNTKIHHNKQKTEKQLTARTKKQQDTAEDDTVTHKQDSSSKLVWKRQPEKYTTHKQDSNSKLL